MTKSPSLAFRLRMNARSELLIVGLIVALAAITRLYQLGAFPLFPPQYPWLGGAFRFGPGGANRRFPHFIENSPWQRRS